ncbi:MAG: hypothetical protein ABIP48_22830 [Planctomycetota bacterium]
MSVTLTTEHGEFHAETEAEAVAQSRKARHQAASAKALRLADYQKAEEEATKSAYRVLYCYVETTHPHQGTTRAWELWFRGDEWFPRVEITGDCESVVHLHDATGTFHVALYRQTLVGYVWDAGGFPLMLWLQGEEGEPRGYVVGSHKGQCCLLVLPTEISFDWAKRCFRAE